ncbi:Transcription elongation factor GreA [Candidatus Hepatincolaceae symbiont of Richtersius coronifer]
MQKFPLTKNGLAVLEKKRSNLETIERRKVIAAITAARELGDLSENAEYHAARDQQSFIEGEINNLTNVIANAEVIDPTTINSPKIIFGATVTLEDLDTEEIKVFQIVGEQEANFSLNLISYLSPLGKTLISKTVEDICDVTTPTKTKSWKVLKIEYK